MQMSFWLVLTLAFLLPDLYIFFVFYKKRVKNIFGRVLYFIPSFLFLACLFAIPRFFPDTFAENTVSWMHFLLAGCFFLFPKLIFSLISLFDFPIKKILGLKKSRFFSFIGLLAAIASIVILITGTWFERDQLEIKHVTLISDDIPESFANYKITQISDLHIGSLVNKELLIREVVTSVNMTNPDIIVITGDVVNMVASELNGMEEFLSQFDAKDGVFSILGNHDYADYKSWKNPSEKEANLELLKSKQHDFGWKMLNNEAVALKRGKDSIALIGVENWGEPPFTKYGDLDTPYQKVAHIPLKILLTHNPSHWEDEVVGEKDIFLTLSGHTHAMQFVLRLFDADLSPASLRYKRWKGLYIEKDQHLYVNPGIGYVGIPFRYGVRPEITVIELKRTK